MSNSMSEKFKAKILEVDPLAFKTHNFKKGQMISNLWKEESFNQVLKVIDVDEYSVLVKDLDSKGIHFTLQKKLWDSFKVMNNIEAQAYLTRKRKSEFWNNCGEIFQWIGSKTNTLNHTKKPTTLNHYLSNLVAFFVTYSYRKYAIIWSAADQKASLMSDLDAHGPIFPWKKSK